jgi:hypothetical protein
MRQSIAIPDLHRGARDLRALHSGARQGARIRSAPRGHASPTKPGPALHRPVARLILLLAALGLAITYGVMGVINMAHGELLMVGAYATYAMQGLFRSYCPSYLDWYLLAAMPVAFFAAALVGMLMERTVIRHLYGRRWKPCSPPGACR